VTVSIGFGYYDYWGWNRYNYWGGHYGGYGRHNYYDGYYRGFYDGFYANDGRKRNTYYGRRTDRAIVPTSGISASGVRPTPGRDDRDGRVGGTTTGGRSQAVSGSQTGDLRSTRPTNAREESGLKPGRETPASIQNSQARP